MKHKKLQKEVNNDSSERVLDLKTIKDTFRKVSSAFSSPNSVLTKYGFLLLLLIPLFIGLTARMQTAYLPIADDWAKDSVHNFYRSQIASAINSQYPTLPEQNKNALIEKQFQELLSTQEGMVNDQIKTVAAQFRAEFQDENGYTWMPDIDPYHFLRFARNNIEHGYSADEVLPSGFGWDNHMVAPLGGPMAKHHPHATVLAYVYHLVRIFEPTATVMYGASFFPILFISLGIIILFFAGYYFAGTIGGTVAGVLFATNFSILNRTFWGHADNDAYNMILPTLMTLFMYLALSSLDSRKKSYIFAVLAAVTITLFSYAWSGWWFIFDFVVLGLIAAAVYFAMHRKWNILKKIGEVSGVFLVTSVILLSFSVGFKGVFFLTLSGASDFSEIKDVGSEKIWPNVLTTVAELNESDLHGILGNLTIGMGYERLFLFLALMGFVLILFFSTASWPAIVGAGVYYLLLLTFKQSIHSIIGWAILMALPLLLIFLYLTFVSKDEHFSPESFFLSVVLVVWIGAGIYASTKGIRFVLLFAPAFVLAVSISIQWIYDRFANWLKKAFSIPTILTNILVICLIIFLLYAPVKNAYAMGKQDVPSVDDAWTDTLFKIRDQTPENTIITSWWDFGHWFKYYADRPVTFDGASQDTPMAHWVGKLLLTNDEELSIGILRMLDCGGSNAANFLDEHFNDLAVTTKHLTNIFKLDRTAARTYLLEQEIPADIAEKVLDETHCTPPTAAVIASGDMVGKSGVWGHFGSWNFDRALQVNIVKNAVSEDEALSRLQSRFGLSADAAQSLYNEIQGADPNQWIAPWPSYASGLNGCARNVDFLVCLNNIGGSNIELQVNLTTKTGKFSVAGDEIVAPARMGFVTEEGIEVVENLNSSFPYGVLLIHDNGNYYTMYMATELVDAMFTHMYFLKGHGLRYYEPFDYQRSITGLEIFTYLADWNGTNATVVESYVPR